MRTSLAILLILTTIVAPGSVRAQASVHRQAALILRILSYDRNLAQRASGRATILVAYRAGDADSVAEHRRMTDALNQLAPRMPVGRLPTSAVGHTYTNRAGLIDAARREGAIAIYVCDGLDSSLADISGAARQAHLLSLTARGETVRRGLSVGFVPQGAEVQLLVNLRAVEAEGARLDATVLRLAEVIR